MGKEQDLLQAVKSADLQTTLKLLSKLKTTRNSKYTPTQHWRLRPLASRPGVGFRGRSPPPHSIASRTIKAALRRTSFLVGGATSAGSSFELGEVPAVTCGGSNEPQGPGAPGFRAERPRTLRGPGLGSVTALACEQASAHVR